MHKPVGGRPFILERKRSAAWLMPVLQGAPASAQVLLFPAGTQQQLFARVSVRPWIGACSAAATSVFVSPIAALRLSPLCNGVDCNILLCFTSNPGRYRQLLHTFVSAADLWSHLDQACGVKTCGSLDKIASDPTRFESKAENTT